MDAEGYFMYRKIFYRLLIEYTQYGVGGLFFRLFYSNETHWNSSVIKNFVHGIFHRWIYFKILLLLFFIDWPFDHWGSTLHDWWWDQFLKHWQSWSYHITYLWHRLHQERLTCSKIKKGTVDKLPAHNQQLQRKYQIDFSQVRYD